MDQHKHLSVFSFIIYSTKSSEVLQDLTYHMIYFAKHLPNN